jgi:DNA topoisomerase-1
MASQMSAAIFNTVSVDFEGGGYVFKSSGNTVKFKGYLAIYGNVDIKEDEDEELAISSLPAITQNEVLQLDNFEKAQHFTEPPPRYNEATLIEFLEENGIGRPSTYAPIITNIMRNYVKHEGKALVPTPIGEITTKLMKQKFPDIVDYRFTADMENKFDSIARGKTTMLSVLDGFYKDFKGTLDSADVEVSMENIEIPPDVSEYTCDKCGAQMVYKNGRFGRFLACPNYPKCKNTKAVDANGKIPEKKEDTSVSSESKCELCGGELVVRNGAYGSFYACKNYPKCRYTKQKLTSIGVPCPKCGADVISKHGRNKSLFYSCQRYPECDFSSWDIPLNEKCEKCGKTLFYKKSKKLVYCAEKDCGYKREDSQREKNESK